MTTKEKEKEKEVGEASNTGNSHRAVSSQVAGDYRNVNDGVIAVGGDGDVRGEDMPPADADGRTVADVLNEVNGFIDSLDDGKDWGGDSRGPAVAVHERPDVGGVNDSEELFSSLSGRYRMNSETQREIEDDAVDGRGHSYNGDISGRDDGDIGVGDDAIKHENDSEEQFFSSSLRNRDERMPEKAKLPNDEMSNDAGQADKVFGKNFSSSRSSSSGCRKYGGDTEKDIFELTRASEDLYNKINTSYKDNMGSSNETSDNTLENSTAGSANSGGGSSVENMPRASRQHFRSYHQLRSRKQQQQRSSQKKILVRDQGVPSINSRVHQDSGMSSQQSNALAKTNNGSSKTDDHPRAVSPFSAKARQAMARRGSTNDHDQCSESTSERLKLSLQNFRRVSLLLKVSPHPQTMTGEDVEAEEGDEVDEDGYGPILFPALVGGGDEDSTAAADEVDTVSSKQSQLRRGEVILVNPHAFDIRGKEGDDSEGLRKNNDSIIKSKERLAGRVTVETARLVAEVSQISSEDWARKFQFDDVCWPTRHYKSLQSSTSSNYNRFNDGHSNYMMSALASSAVEDILNLSCRAENFTKDDHNVPCSTMLFAVGGSASGKTQTIFGSSLASLVSSSTGKRMIQKNDDSDNGHGLGLLGEIVSGILSSQHAVGKEHFDGSIIASERPFLKCSLSILEIVNADVMRDVLGVSEEGLGENGGSKSLRVRHLDARGAAVLNLRQATIETMEQLNDILHVSFKSNILRRSWSTEGGHGHFIVTVCVSRPDGYCGKIQLADLAGPDRHASSAATLGDVRKSLSALRGVLRGLVTQHANHTTSPMPYRESTLTKLLQRSLDASTRSVVIGTVSSSTKKYNQTLATMNFMSRILAKAGETALSPFHDAVLTAKTGHGERRRNREDAGLLIRSLDDSQPARKSITSDPRQRLAKLLGSTPVCKGGVKTSKGIVHNNEVNTPKNCSLLSNDAKSRQFRDNYEDVFTRLDSLMVADDDDLDRNSFGEDIIEALTPYKARATNDGSSVDSSEGMTPSPFRDNFRTNQSDNGRLRQLELKQKDDRMRLDELYNGVERKDARSTELLRTLFSRSENAVGDTRPPLQTEIGFHSHSQDNSSHNRNDSSSQMSNDDSLDESRRQSVPGSLPQIERTKQLPKIVDAARDHRSTGVPNPNSSSDYSKPSHHESNEGNLSEPRPTETHFLTEPPELDRRIPTNDQPSVCTDLKSERLTEKAENENPSVDSYQLGGRNASRVCKSIFVEKSKLAPPSMLFILDSMDSEEPLVSARGLGAYFGDSARQMNTPLSHPLDSIDLPASPTYAMFESFKNEIDTLVVTLTEEKITTDDSTVGMLATADATALEATALEATTSALADVTALERAEIMSEEKRLMENPKYAIHEDQISSLKEEVQSLSKVKNASEAFFSKIRSFINEGEAQTSIGYEALEDWIPKKLSLLVELESQLESFQTEKDNLSRELERAQEKISELSLSVQHVEKNLVEARETIDSQAHASASLESQIERLEEQIKDLHKSQHSSSVFVGRLDKLLRISTDRASVSDESQHETRLDSIKNLQSRFQDGSMKLKESQNYVIRLESKAQELEDQLRILQESHNQIGSKRLESDKLCEEAISASETLAKEVGEVRSELAMEQKAHQVLLTAHNAALGDNKELSRKYDKIMTQVVERDHEISRLNLSFNTCHEEKAQLKDQLSSIRIKTVDVMKQHIEVLRVDYARRIEEFKADHENEELSRLRLDLSNKEAENANLRRRNEHIEKFTSLKIHNAEEKLCQIQGELTSVSKEAFIQREERNAMQEELDHLRSLMDIAEESVGELNRLKEENQQLTAMIRYQNDQGSRLSSIDVPFEIRGRSDEDLMHERISALMRENEQNNISMRTLQNENVALKSSIEECTSTIQLVHSEMTGLKMIANDGVSKIRTREEKLLADQRKYKDEIAAMEQKLENANSLIRSLRSSSSSYYDAQGGGMLSKLNALSHSKDRLRTNAGHQGSRSRMEDYHATPPRDAINKRQYAAELSTEKELRYKAEEICAGVLANSKVALEERDSEISKLRSQLFRISSKRHIESR